MGKGIKIVWSREAKNYPKLGLAAVIGSNTGALHTNAIASPGTVHASKTANYSSGFTATHFFALVAMWLLSLFGS